MRLNLSKLISLPMSRAFRPATALLLFVFAIFITPCCLSSRAPTLQTLLPPSVPILLPRLLDMRWIIEIPKSCLARFADRVDSSLIQYVPWHVRRWGRGHRLGKGKGSLLSIRSMFFTLPVGIWRSALDMSPCLRCRRQSLGDRLGSFCARPQSSAGASLTPKCWEKIVSSGC